MKLRQVVRKYNRIKMKKILLIVGGIILLAVVALPVLRSQTKKHSPEALVTFNSNGFYMQLN